MIKTTYTHSQWDSLNESKMIEDRNDVPKCTLNTKGERRNWPMLVFKLLKWSKKKKERERKSMFGLRRSSPWDLFFPVGIFFL